MRLLYIVLCLLSMQDNDIFSTNGAPLFSHRFIPPFLYTKPTMQLFQKDSLIPTLHKSLLCLRLLFLSKDVTSTRQLI